MRRLRFYNNIKKFRLSLGYTQKQLADLCGVSQNTISDLENNNCGCTAYLSGIICSVLGRTWDEVFYYVKDNNTCCTYIDSCLF